MRFWDQMLDSGALSVLGDAQIEEYLIFQCAYQLLDVCTWETEEAGFRTFWSLKMGAKTLARMRGIYEFNGQILDDREHFFEESGQYW